MGKIYLFAFVMILFCSSCKTLTSVVEEPVVEAKPASILMEATEILSLVIQIERGTPDTYTVHRMNKTEGYLKREHTAPQESAGIDFQIDAIDADGVVLKELYHRNPYQQTLEYSPEPKKLAKATIEEEHPILLIKMNWLPNIHSLILKKRKDGVVIQSDKIALSL